MNNVVLLSYLWENKNVFIMRIICDFYPKKKSLITLIFAISLEKKDFLCLLRFPEFFCTSSLLRKLVNANNLTNNLLSKGKESLHWSRSFDEFFAVSVEQKKDNLFSRWFNDFFTSSDKKKRNWFIQHTLWKLRKFTLTEEKN